MIIWYFYVIFTFSTIVSLIYSFVNLKSYFDIVLEFKKNKRLNAAKFEDYEKRLNEAGSKMIPWLAVYAVSLFIYIAVMFLLFGLNMKWG